MLTLEILTDRDADEVPVGDPYVVCWRYDRLCEAGYPSDIATLLSERRDVDLHGACELLERGCPVDWALQILT